MKKKIKIKGMTCQHCVDAVTNALENVNGVDLCKVKIGSATIETCLSGPEQIIELEHAISGAVNKAGYSVKSIK
ncbi:MAG: heavy-metal-associated domain-containing protein [Spirochaetales bacterium]|nr:heavy-metal-associated domain-containing protein [Spirochaetales bacterium]